MNDADYAHNIRAVEPHARRVLADHEARLDSVEGLTGGWSSEGELVSVWSDDPAGHRLDLRDGFTATPVTAYKSSMKVSRVQSIQEAQFAGDGSPGTAAIYGANANLASSQAQAVGVFGGATTRSSYEGEHSLADAAGGYFVGRSIEGTRTGIGAFISGRRDTNSGRTTGAEIVSDNATATADAYNGTLPGTKGIHLHPVGLANSAAGLVLGHPSTASWDAGIVAVPNSVVTSTFRDDSSSLRSILVRGSHEKAAIAVASAAGPVVIGAEALSSAGPLMEIFTGEANADPALRIGTGKAFATSIEVRTEAGNAKFFASASTNGFLTGTGNGGTGIMFSNTKTFKIGRVGGSGDITLGGGVGFNGVAPVAKAAEIAVPAETFASQKTFNEAVKAALKNIGITA